MPSFRPFPLYLAGHLPTVTYSSQEDAKTASNNKDTKNLFGLFKKIVRAAIFI